MHVRFNLFFNLDMLQYLVYTWLSFTYVFDEKLDRSETETNAIQLNQYTVAAVSFFQIIDQCYCGNMSVIIMIEHFNYF